eukprot:Skav205253  [mRNA]  locus=scaffold1841:18594:19640:- [translate_table: standard]
MLSKPSSTTVEKPQREHYATRYKRIIKEEQEKVQRMTQFLMKHGLLEKFEAVQVEPSSVQPSNVPFSSHGDPDHDPEGDDPSSDDEGSRDGSRSDYIKLIIDNRIDMTEFSLEVHRDDGAVELMFQIEGFKGIITPRQRLMTSNMTENLEDFDPIGGYDIKDGDKIVMLENDGSRVSGLVLPDYSNLITVNMVENFGARQTHAFQVPRGQHVWAVKAMLQGRTGIRSRDMSFIFNNDILENEQVVEDDNVNIFVSLLLRGSAPPRKRKINFKDLRQLNDDHEYVKAVFAVDTFKEDKWLESLEADKVRSYFRAIKSRNHFDHQVASTVSHVREFAKLKDCSMSKFAMF